jgi:small subunit ribosomal protein S25e
MGQKKSKEAIARAAMASRKTSKKKWSKGKEKEKKDLAVFVTPK